MTPETKQILYDINRAFYAAVADDFDASRQHAWPGWQRVIGHLRSTGAQLTILDVGCGNGRFASCLDACAPGPFRYRGIDASARLLAHARTAHTDAAHIRFDAIEIDVSSSLDEWQGGPFDLVAVFGFLHHLPGFETRQRMLAGLVGALAPRGLLALTAWRFDTLERFEKRTLPWAEYNETATRCIDIADLESGDHLLRFQDAPEPRFCHLIDRKEMRELIGSVEASQIDEFDADGRSGELNHYAILQRD